MAVVSANQECHVVNGLHLPPFVTRSQLDHLADFELFTDDTWLVTYPGSGSTLAQQIVRLILSKGDGITKRVDYAIPWLEATNKVHIFSTLKRPRAFKSHMPYLNMPCGLPSNTPCKYIAVVRNPKDVAVSLYHHYNTLFYMGKLRWDEFISWFLSGDVMFGDYFDHVLGWWKHREDENVLLLKYEDMIKDLHSSTIQVAQFMSHTKPQDIVKKIDENSSFGTIKCDSSVNQEWLSIDLRLDLNRTKFNRKIIVGWKEYFTPEQSAQCDDLYAQKLMSVGCELNFE